MVESRLQRWAHIATISAAFVGIVTLLGGYVIFREGQNAQKEATAVGMLQKHIEIALANPELATGKAGRQIDQRYILFANMTLFTAEVIHQLRAGDPAWDATVRGLVSQHQGYLGHETFVLDEYDPTFGAFLKREFPDALRNKTARK